MSLVFACVTTNGVVLSSDSRVTNLISGREDFTDDGIKLFSYGRFPAALGMSGYYTGIHEIALRIDFNEKIRHRAKLLENVSRRSSGFMKKTHEGQSHEKWPSLELILGIVAECGPEIVYAHSRENAFKMHTCSGNAVLIGCQKHYNEALRSVCIKPVDEKSACELACHLIKKTSEIDKTVGGEVKICVVNKTRSRMLSAAEVESFAGKSNAVIEAVEREKDSKLSS